MELPSKISLLNPVSFDTSKRKDTIAIKIIIDLLQDSIENKKVIKVIDIRIAHAKYSMQRRMHRAGWMYVNNEKGERECVRAKTIEDWLACWSDEWKSIPWFKMNLGAAILKGRLLAIPIIEID